jgi:hypothetical protein
MTNRPLSTEEIAILNMARVNPAELREQLRKQLEIMQAMQGVVADARRSNPNAYGPPNKAIPAGAPMVVEAGETRPRGTGWRDPIPFQQPPGQDIIKRLVNTALPHSKNSKAG